MGERSEDRRARRSRRLLKQGLLELMRGKKFAEISVRDITERMDLNRGTFYLHYADTAELLHSLQDDMMNELQQLIDEHLQETVEARSIRPVLEPILEYVSQRRETVETLLNNNDAGGFMERFQRLIHENGSRLPQLAAAEGEEQHFLLSFISYGLVGLIREWYDRELCMPKEQLIAAADRMIDGAARQLNGARKED